MGKVKYKLCTGLILISLPLIANAADVTLSDSILLSLDWHDPSINAKVVAVRNSEGPGVEFDIQFPGTAHPNASLHFISGKFGGAGMLAGLDLKEFDNFALTFTLLAVDGNDKPPIEGGLIVGSLVYNPSSHYAYRPEVVNISSSGEKKAATSATRLNKGPIDGLGFQARLPTSTKWKAGTTLTLLVAPTPGAVPIEPRVFVPAPGSPGKVTAEPKNVSDSKSPNKQSTPLAEKPADISNRPAAATMPAGETESTGMTYRQWLIGMALSAGRSAADSIRDADEVIRLLSAANP